MVGFHADKFHAEILKTARARHYLIATHTLRIVVVEMPVTYRDNVRTQITRQGIPHPCVRVGDDGYARFRCKFKTGMP